MVPQAGPDRHADPEVHEDLVNTFGQSMLEACLEPLSEGHSPPTVGLHSYF